MVSSSASQIFCPTSTTITFVHNSDVIFCDCTRHFSSLLIVNRIKIMAKYALQELCQQTFFRANTISD